MPKFDQPKHAKHHKRIFEEAFAKLRAGEWDGSDETFDTYSPETVVEHVKEALKVADAAHDALYPPLAPVKEKVVKEAVLKKKAVKKKNDTLFHTDAQYAADKK